MNSRDVPTTLAENSIVDGKSDMPLIIAGPCSAESESQVMSTARQIAKINDVSIFRAGVWKPRTRPNGFEGVGFKGLAWLQMVKSETGLDIAIEVANSHHVEQALDHKIDYLWIGARTTVNPFSVQEIANALKGVDIPVMVKNPVNPDVKAWIGALERIIQAGIKKIYAIHRGFSTFEKTPYRNAPKWEIPIELKRQFPEIPIISDPSHISGNRDLIADLSQKAMDLAMDGLMIETHINPDAALSDAAQQITPDTLDDILRNLKIRKPEGNGLNGKHTLEYLREEMDTVDNLLLETIGKRIDLTKKLGTYKKNHNMTILQVNRWQQVLEDRLKQANYLGLDEKLVKDIYQLLHNQSVKIQGKMLNEDD
jgi:chorismate mutase